MSLIAKLRDVYINYHVDVNLVESDILRCDVEQIITMNYGLIKFYFKLKTGLHYLNH